MSKSKAELTFEVEETEVPSIGITMRDRNGHQVSLTKTFLDGIPGKSRQDYLLGRREHPYDFTLAATFKQHNVHHSACIEAKKASTVGLGFYREPEMEENPERASVEEHNAETERVAIEADKRQAALKPKPLAKAIPAPAALPSPERVKKNPLTGEPILKPSKVSQVLDGLCRISFQHVIDVVAEDFWVTGNGWIEVVRNDSGEIVALYPAHAREVFIVVEDDWGNIHYEVQGADGTSVSRVFASFGDSERLLRSQGQMLGGFAPIPTVDLNRKRGRPRKDGSGGQMKLTELIHIPRPTAQDRFYGWAEWLAACLPIELVQCKHQHLFNFFFNRAVPDLLIGVMGEEIPNDIWADFNKALRAHTGLKNSHKTFTFRLPAPDAKIEVHKLGMEGQSEGLFAELSDILASEIVTAHGVPPLLAGIQIPGKLGANNELANALIAFQALRIGPAQGLFTTVLRNTLGKEFPEIEEKDWELRTILEKLDVQKMDTMSRMRETAGDAQAKGRDLSAGVKK